MTKAYRGRYIIIAHMLNTINNSGTEGANKTTIMYKAFLSYGQLKEYLSFMVDFGRLAYYKKNNINPANYMKVIPTPFNTQGGKMLQHAKSLLEDKDNVIAIDKRFDKLLTAFRTAVANEYKLDKEQTSYHDLLDAFRLSLQLYQRSNK